MTTNLFINAIGYSRESDPNILFEAIRSLPSALPNVVVDFDETRFH